MTKGFTILEILLYISILSAGLALLTGIYYVSGEIKTKNEVIIEINSRGNQVIDLVRQDIESSPEIRFPKPGQSAESLVLGNEQGEEVVFIARDKQLDRSDNQGAFNLLSDQVFLEGLIFTTIGDKNGRPIGVNLDFNLRYSNSSGRNEYNHYQSFNTFVLKR